MSWPLAVGRPLWATLVLALLLLADARTAAATDYFVSPSGLPTNNGAIDHPLDLTTALSEASPVRPGDTVWLRGGVYVGVYSSVIAGTANARITVRQYPGERATLDGAGSPLDVLTVYGGYVTFWGFEIMNSDPQRTTFQDGPWPNTMHRGAGVIARGTNLKFINLVFHDLLYGAGVWIESVETEVYGSLFYFNGWQGSDGSHGHGIYTQNDTGTRLLRENILFNQFRFGIQAYGSSTAFVDNLTLEGNVLFNNGIVGANGFERDILIGGQLAHHPVLNENYTYGGAHTFLGYGDGCQGGIVTNNYFVGRDPLILEDCTPAMSGNALWGLEGHLSGYSALPAAQYPNNTYFSARPTTNFVNVRKNLYEPGRGHVVIYNWTRQPVVSIDLSPIGLALGDAYEIRDAQNFFGSPVATGIYDGLAVGMPMTGLALTDPVGTLPVLPPHTAPEFGVFVVLRTGGPVPTPQPEAAMPTFTPAGTNFVTPLTVSISTTSAGAEIRYTTDGSTPGPSSPLYTGPFTVATTTTVRARAYAPGMIESLTATAVFAYSSGATATYVGADNATKGSWRGVYGRDGAMIVADSTSYPAYAQVTASGQGAWTWSPSTTDPRALERASGANRVAATWHAYTFNVKIDITDNRQHQLALYTIDWDSQPRTERVEILDGVTGTVIDTRTVSAFSGGRYLVWKVSGRIIVRMICSLGPNAVLSGLFFDPVPGETLTPAATPVINPAGGTFVGPVTVTLGSPTPGATTYYTLNGSVPDTASTPYVGPFVVSSSSTVNARAFAPGLAPSATATAAFTINLPTAAAPVITPTGGTFVGPVPVTLTSSTSGAAIRYTTDGSTPTGGSTLYTGPLTISTNTTLKARAFAAGMLDSATTSGVFTITVPPDGGPGAATFIRADTATQGSWRGIYGADGAAVVGDTLGYPAYAQAALSGAAPFVWNSTTTDGRALQRTTGTTRLAATWYSATAFTIDLALTDGLPHDVSLYTLDWDTTARGERIDVKDAVSGALLDTQTLTGFDGGRYTTWRLKGHVVIVITRTAGANAVLSGLFFDPPSSPLPPPSTVAAPTITPGGGVFGGPVTVSLSTITTGATIRYTTDGSAPGASSPVYANPLLVSSTTTVSARAFAAGMLDSSVTTATFSLPPPVTAGATFVRTDTTTIGNWKGVFGADGAVLAGDDTVYPVYAQASWNGQTAWNWSTETTDPRALLRRVGDTRQAATWFTGNAFSIDLDLTDGQSHQVALYNLDWDSTIRAQRVEIRNAATGALLDSRSVTGFNGGQYFVWRLTGHVLITVTRTGGANAVTSAIFFDP